MVVSCDKLIGVILLDMPSMHVSFLLSRFVKTSDSRFGLQSSDGVERTSRMGARSPCWYFSVLVVSWYFSATGVNCSLAGSNTSALLGWIFQCDHIQWTILRLFVLLWIDLRICTLLRLDSPLQFFDYTGDNNSPKLQKASSMYYSPCSRNKQFVSAI